MENSLKKEKSLWQKIRSFLRKIGKKESMEESVLLEAPNDLKSPLIKGKKEEGIKHSLNTLLEEDTNDETRRAVEEEMEKETIDSIETILEKIGTEKENLQALNGSLLEKIDRYYDHKIEQLQEKLKKA